MRREQPHLLLHNEDSSRGREGACSHRDQRLDTQPRVIPIPHSAPQESVLPVLKEPAGYIESEAEPLCHWASVPRDKLNHSLRLDLLTCAAGGGTGRLPAGIQVMNTE